LIRDIVQIVVAECDIGMIIKQIVREIKTTRKNKKIILNKDIHNPRSWHHRN